MRPGIGRETSSNLVEARTVLSRAQTALGNLRAVRVHPRWTYDENGRNGVYSQTTEPDPDHDELSRRLSQVVELLLPYQRTGRPRKEPK